MNEDLKNKVLEKIRRKEVTMHPRVYFAMKVGIIVFISVMAFLLLAFSLSFVFFSIHESGEQFLLGFGIQGILVFFRLFPWTVLLFTAILFFILEWLLHHFKWGYRLPMMRIFIFTLLVTILSSALLTLTPVHSNLLRKASGNELPVIGGIYEAIHDSHEAEGVLREYIISMKTGTLIISSNDKDTDTDDGTWNVILPSGMNASDLYIGEKVYVAGKIIGNNIYAYGVHNFLSNQ